jgi:2-hydroxychromene-2-carboxylate isomerase
MGLSRVSERPEFFFGAMSPYSWFAAERIDGVIPGAEWRPVFAGGVFKACGRSSWGLDGRRPAGIADCEARAQQRGLGAIRWPDPWPTADVRVARAMLVARDAGLLKPFALAAMRLAFREGCDLDELSAIEEAGRRVGLDPADLTHAIQAPEVKLAMREETADAVAKGVFGVPTVLFENELFWGDDHLEDAAAAVARRPPAT